MQVFSRLQMAQVSVTSYPFFPDMLHLGRAIEAAASEQTLCPTLGVGVPD